MSPARYGPISAIFTGTGVKNRFIFIHEHTPVRAANNPAIKSLLVLEAPVLEICPEEFEL